MAFREPAHDVIVVGAGLAGLVAARELQAHGLNVVLIEARSRVGGRAYSSATALGGYPCEFGGMFVDNSQTAVMTELHRYGLAVHEYEPPRSVHWYSAGSLRSDTFVVPFSELDSLERVVRFLQDAALAWNTGERVAGSVADHLSALQLGEHTRDLVTAFLSTESSAPLHQVSMRGLAEDLATTRGQLVPWVRAALLTGTVAGGIQLLAERIAADVVSLRLSLTAQAISLNRHDVSIDTTGGVLLARRVVLATPLNTWHELHLTPGWPGSASELARRGHAGRGFKVNLLLSGPMPDIVLAAHPVLQLLRVVGRLPQGRTSVAAFGTITKTLVTAPDNGLLQEALHTVAPGTTLLASAQHDWAADPFAQGTWLSHHHDMAGDAVHALERLQPLLTVAGSDVADVGASYLEGAVRSGHKATQTVLENW